MLKPDETHGFLYDSEQSAGQEEKQPETAYEEIEVEDVDSLSEEDLANATVDDDTGKVTVRKPVKKDETDDKEENENTSPEDKENEDEKKTKDDDEKPPEDKTPTVAEQIADIEKIPKDDRTDAQTLELRRLHAEQRMTQATMEASDLRKDLEKTKRELFELKNKQKPDFELLDEEDEQELKETDPDEYNKYVAEKQEFETAQRAVAIETVKNTFTNIAAFYKAIKGVDVAVSDLIKTKPMITEDGQIITDPKTGQPIYEPVNKEFGEFLQSDEFKKIDQYVMNNMRTDYDGSIPINVIHDAHLIVNKDKILSDAQLAGREQALNDINNANHSDASSFDTVPKSDGKTRAKKVSDLTDDEIENMSDRELAAMEKQMQEEGMA